MHVLCQSGARIYNYSVLSPDGLIKIRHHYNIVGSRPRLVFKEGEIIVAGGLKLLRPDDVPSRNKNNEKPKLILPETVTKPIPVIREPVAEQKNSKQ